MSSKKQNKIAKRRSHDQMDSLKDKKKHLSLSLCEVESKSSSCGSRKSHKKLANFKNEPVDRDNFFIVDKIVGHKVYQGKSYFKVQWQGYDESEDSWEPEENLCNVLDLIEEFKNGKISDCKCEENNRSATINRSRNAGCYEYVASNKVVAMKTKYFDDIRDGKIDLTKNDLYSRVKTRKRLHLEDIADKRSDNAEIVNEDLSMENLGSEIVEVVSKPEDVAICYGKSKFYQTNLFEMTAEFMKSGSFKKSQNTIASKSSSNDDISLFNYSISPNTNQSDEFVVQISPVHQTQSLESNKQSVYTQTVGSFNDSGDSADTDTKVSQPPADHRQSNVANYIKPQVQRIIDKIEQTFERSSTPQRLVTNETHLLSIYAREVRQGNVDDLNLPLIQTESDLMSIDSFDDLKCSIVMDKYHLLHDTLKAGTTFDWEARFVPEGLTPLQLAVTKNRVNIVRLLLRYGAAPDHCADDADSDNHPLILASTLGHVHSVKALLEHGAFTDYRTKQHSRTALFFAIENGRVDVVNLLLRFGTNFYRIADSLSSSSLVNDMLMSNSLASLVCVDLLALLRDYHTSFIRALNRTVGLYLSKHLFRETCTIFPHQWVSVLERQFRTEFLLDSSIMTNIETPVLLLVHGLQADCDFEFWIDNDCCCVDSVYVNGKRQASLSSACFITTLWPLTASSNTLTVQFIDRQLLSAEERQIRVAIVAISIDCHNRVGVANSNTNGNANSNSSSNNNKNSNSLFQQIAHSRHYH